MMGFGGRDVQRWQQTTRMEHSCMDVDSRDRGQVWRTVGYVVVAAAALHAVVQATASIVPPDDARYEALLGEDGWVEWSQAALYAAAGVALVVWGVGRVQRAVGWFVVGMAVRELDGWLEDVVASGTHRWLYALCLLLAALAYLGARRASDPARDPPFARLSTTLLWIGVLTSMGFAQLLGQRDAWRQIVRQEYGSQAKRLAEEGLELLGAVWIALAVVEQLVFRHRASARRGGPDAPVA